MNYALFVSLFIYRDINLKQLYEIMVRCVITTAVIMFVIATSAVLSWILANQNIPTLVAKAVLSLSSDPYVIMLLITSVILLTGFFVETASALIILTPVFLPLINNMGIDLIHFGLIIVVGLAIGMVTPPVAINLYVASSITGLPIERISRAIIPYLIGLLTALALVVYLPMIYMGI